MVALQGAVPSATLESARAWVLGDPLLRGGDSRETAVRFLEAAARGDAERFLKDRVLGNFVLCHAERDRIHLYSSAAGLHHAFYDASTCASTSLASVATMASPEFDPVIVYQFLCAGYTLGGQTVFDGVSRLLGGEVLDTEGSRLVRRRWHRLAFPQETLSVGALSAHIARTFDECRPALEDSAMLCADVTGGFDTRLVVAMLHYLKLPFRGWVSGRDDEADVTIAKQLGERLGFPVRQVDVSEMIEAAAAFGVQQFERQAFLRPFQAWLDMMFGNAQCPECDGLRISGHGGEQFRDFPWQQEFPFYGMRTRPNLDFQIRLRFLATQVDSDFMHGDLARTVRAANFRRVHADMSAFVDEIAPPDNLTASLAIYLAFREAGRVGSSASEKRRFFPNWAPWLEPEIWLRSGSTSWFSRLGAGLSLLLAERFAPELRGLETEAMSARTRGAAALTVTARHYAGRATAKLVQKVRNRPYATGQAKVLPVLETLLRRPRFQDLVRAAIEPCQLNEAKVEAALREPGRARNAEVLGALVPLGRLAEARQTASAALAR